MFVSRLALYSFLLAITACGDPLDVTMTPSKETPIPQDLLDKVPQEERELLLRGVFRRSLASGLSGGDSSVGTVNLRDLIDEQREIEARLKAEADAAQALQAEIAARREADLAAVRGLVTTAFTKITYREANWRVNRYRGTGTAFYEGALDYNQFDQNHRALLGFDPAKGKTVFEPERINFADGTHVDIAPAGE